MQKQEKGLKFGKTDAYTDLSDAFLIKEASKINYELPPILSPNLPPN